MPPSHPPRRISGPFRSFFAWWLGFCAICAYLAPPAPEAVAASSKSKKKKSKKKKQRAPAKKSGQVRPASRDASVPQAVPSEEDPELEGDGEGDLEGDDTGDPESELERIERELLEHPPEAEVRFVEPAPEPPRKAVFIKHKVIPGETLEEIAKRYGVTPADIGGWNGLSPTAPIPRMKKDLRVKTSVVPVPRERHEHLVRRGDTWESVAKAMGVEVATLRRQNPRLPDKLDPKKKHKVQVWRDLDVAPSVALSTKLGQIRVRGGGISIGKPSKGRLVRGVELPDRPDLYTRRKPEENFGSTHTVVQMLAAFTRFRHESGYKGQVSIGGMSRARGGRFRPHKSHQSGRDVDIRLPLLMAAQDKKNPTSGDVDWSAAWKLIHAFLVSGEVEYIFLDYSLQKRVYEAARKAGATKEQLEQWLQWPAKPRTNKGVIRHVEGHRAHIHVRVRCAPSEKSCYSSR